MINSPEGGPRLDCRDIEDRLEGFGKPLKQYSLNGHRPSEPFDLEDRLEDLAKPPRLTARDRWLRTAVVPIITFIRTIAERI